MRKLFKFISFLLILALSFSLIGCQMEKENIKEYEQEIVEAMPEVDEEDAKAVKNLLTDVVDMLIDSFKEHFGDVDIGEVAENVDREKTKETIDYAFSILRQMANTVFPSMEDDSVISENSENETVAIVEIIDRTKEEQIDCADALDMFYEDETNRYYFSVIKNDYIIVKYDNGHSEDIVTAMNAGRATLSDLNKFGIEYYTEPKQ